MLVVLGFVYFVYMMARSRWSLTQIVSFTMALGNTYGLLLLTACLGSGLVALPKRLWEKSCVTEELQRLYIQAISVEDAFQDARYALEDVECEVDDVYQQCQEAATNKAPDRNVGTATPAPTSTAGSCGGWFSALTGSASTAPAAASSPDFLRSYAAEIQRLHLVKQEFVFAQRSQTRQLYVSARPNGASGSGGTHKPRKAYDKAGVVTLHSRLLLSQIKARAAEQRWRLHIQQLLALQQQQPGGDALVTEAAQWSRRDADAWCGMDVESAAGGGSRSNRLCSCAALARGLGSWCPCASAANVPPQLYAALGWLCAALSLVVLWSELVLGSRLPSVPGLCMGCSYSACAIDSATNTQQRQAQQVLVQAVAFLFLCYLSVCTYATLFRINLGGFYRLQAPQLSPHTSLLINAQYVSRLQFSIGYNFLSLLHVSPALLDRTAFRQLIQRNMSVLPIFGSRASIAIYVPLCLGAFALLSWFDGLGRLLQWLGIETEESSLALLRTQTTGTSGGGGGGGGPQRSELMEKCQQGRQVVQAELKRLARLKDPSTGPVGTATISATAASAPLTVRVAAVPPVVTAASASTPRWSSFLPSFTAPKEHAAGVSSTTAPDTSESPGLSLGGRSTTRSRYSRLDDQRRIDDEDGREEDVVELGLYGAAPAAQRVLNPLVQRGAPTLTAPRPQRDLFSLLDDDASPSSTSTAGRYG